MKMRSFFLAAATILGAAFPSLVNASNAVLVVQGYIDNVDTLIIQGDTLQWTNIPDSSGYVGSMYGPAAIRNRELAG